MKISRLESLLKKEEHRAFILDHLEAPIEKALLKYAADPNKRLLLEQVAARQRIRKKLPGWYENPHLILPPRLNLEQASSEETAALKASLFKGAHFADLTGGLGIDSIAFSKKFDKLTYNDRDPLLAEIARYNFNILGLQATVCQEPAEELIGKLPQQDLLYLDPARRSKIGTKLISLLDYQPPLPGLLPAARKKARQILVKLSPMLSVSEVEKVLKPAEIWMISYRNEGKELLALLSPSAQSGKISYRAWNINAADTQYFEKDEIATATEPGAVDTYLFEPNSSLLKLNLSDAHASELGLKKIQAFSHLFTASEDKPHFQGRRFFVKKQHRSLTKSFKAKPLSVLVRNHPLKAEEVRKRFKLKQSDNQFLIITTDLKGALYLEAERLF